MMTEQQAIEAIIAYRNTTGKKQAEIAKELDISESKLSQFLAGSYKAPHTVIPAVEALMKQQENKALAPKAPGYAETSVSKRVMDAIEYCHLMGKPGVIFGDAGIGKTMAIEKYCQENPMAISITISPVFATISGVNDLLADKMGIQEKNSRRFFMEAVRRLKGSGRVIIIDEAQHLTKKTIEHIRSLSDQAEIGVCYVGNEEVYRRLNGTGKADFAQIFNRNTVNEQVLLSSIKKDDIQKIFSESQLDEESLDFLYKIAKTRYGIRGAVNVYVAAVALFGAADVTKFAQVAKKLNIK